MRLTIQRDDSQLERTFGTLLCDGDALGIQVLEDAMREVPGQDVVEWKVKGATAIPVGVYRVTLEHSNRFGPNTLTINDVPGFAAIRMHGGNTEADTEGCPLLGLNRTKTGINNCAPAVTAVKKLVADAAARDEEVFIEVLNP